MKYIYIVSFLPSSTTVYVTKKGSCRHNLLTIKYFSTVVDFTTLQVRYFVCRTSKLCSSRVKVAVAMCAVTRSKLVKVRASNTDSQYIYIVEKYLLEAGFVIQRSTPQPTTNFTSSLVWVSYFVFTIIYPPQKKKDNVPFQSCLCTFEHF